MIFVYDNKKYVRYIGFKAIFTKILLDNIVFK